MSYIRSTITASPFATSTTYTSTGPSAYSQSWVTVNQSTLVATLSGRAIATNCAQGTLARYYFSVGNNFPQSGQAFETTFQSFISGSDECIASGNSFKITNLSNAPTTTSRAHIMRTGF